MLNKFTPGPWEVKHSESKPAYNVIGTVLGSKYKIARCPYIITGDPVIDEREMKESEANARLIAAARTMIEALQNLYNIVKYDEQNQDLTDALHGAYIAIQKATKEAPHG